MQHQPLRHQYRIGDLTGKVDTNRPPASREGAVTVRPGVPSMSTLETHWRISHAADVRYLKIDLILVAGVTSAGPPILTLIAMSRRK